MTSLRRRLDARAAGVDLDAAKPIAKPDASLPMLDAALKMGLTICDPVDWDSLIDPLVYEKMLESSRYENERFDRLRQRRSKEPKTKKHSKARLKSNSYQDPSG